MVKTDLDSDGKIFSCYQRVDYANGDTFFFRIVSSCGELTKEGADELEKTVEACFTFSKNETSLYNAVKSIRTIFRNLEEIELEVSIFNKSEKKVVFLTYKIGTLEYREYANIEGNQAIETIVNKAGITTKWNNNEPYKEYLDSLSGIVNTYQSLLKVLPNEITNDDRVLCTVYEQFYGQMPDFRNNEDVVRMHLLNLYLSSFELYLKNDEKFCTFTEGYPILPSQQSQIEKIKLFGNLEEQVGQYFWVDLNESTVDRINSIKDVFATSANINNIDINSLEILKQIATIAYIYTYEFVGQERSATEYASLSGIPEEEASKILTFYKTAKLKINQ